MGGIKMIKQTKENEGEWTIYDDETKVFLKISSS